jgi:hypothetical protein
MFLRNGEVKTGRIVSIGKSTVFFKTTDTSETRQYQKTELLLVEDNKGTRYIFAENNDAAPEQSRGGADLKRNSLGAQPLGIFLGRATVVYERLSENGRIGYAFPFSLTFDPFGPIFKTGIDTGSNAFNRIRGLNFIAGCDVNFYLGERPKAAFFIGPRMRYGTDLFMRDIEAWTIQTQMGWRLGNPSGVFVQHLSLGFGFIRILSSPAGTVVDPRQSYGWYSLNYRLGFNW